MVDRYKQYVHMNNIPGGGGGFSLLKIPQKVFLVRNFDLKKNTKLLSK